MIQWAKTRNIYQNKIVLLFITILLLAVSRNVQKEGRRHIGKRKKKNKHKKIFCLCCKKMEAEKEGQTINYKSLNLFSQTDSIINYSIELP